MKKLFLLLILLPGLAWAGHFGSSTSGKEATVTWSYTSTCDSAWMVFGYDGDAGEPDTANMYDSLKLVQCFSGTGKELCGDGLDLDSIGSHVVRMYCFFGDAVIGIRVGKWEQKAAASGSCPTVDEIVDGILGENDTTVIDTSQLGKWLIANIGTEASCFGAGARTVNIDVKNIADSIAINGFRVDVYDSSSGNFVDKQNTNINGRTTWSLDDDTYTVHLSDDGWTITTPQYLTISGDATQTYYATVVTVSPPPTDSVCVVYGYIKDRSGVGIRNARVKMWIPEYPVKFHDVIVNALEPYEVKTDSDGKFEFSLGFYPNSLLTPSGTLYMFRVESGGFRFEMELEVPLADSYEVSLDL